MGIDEFKISRRTLLGASGGIVALVAVADPSLFVAAPAQPSRAVDVSDIRYIVTDRRHPQSLAFARAYVARGSQPLEVVDGLTRMWQQSLLPLWQQRAGAVAGLTTQAVWHCLAEQARSHALRTRVLAPLSGNDGHPNNLVSWIIA